MTSPNPDWKPGDTVQSPVEKMITLDPEEATPLEMYKLIIGSVVPRPIAFVSTINSTGEGNLAPFSFFNGVSSNPPCLMFSIGLPQSGEKKHTLRNIEETGEFVVNSSNEWLVEPLVHCAAEYPYGVNEMEKVGLTGIPSEKVKPARVKESSVQFECQLYDKLAVGPQTEPGSSTIIVGQVVLVHVDENAYDNGRITFDKIRPVARLGGFGYGQITSTFEIPVPKV